MSGMIFEAVPSISAQEAPPFVLLYTWPMPGPVPKVE
jgi:hypothetical protein